MKELFHYIRRPLVTEKMTGLQEKHNQYAFEVDERLNKIEIARGLEKRFDVKIKSVRTMNYKGKFKRMGRTEGRRKNWKKAIVSLEQGYKIELFEGV